MDRPLPIPTDSSLSPTLDLAARTAEEYLRRARAQATHRAYTCDWNDFTAWCASHGLQALPADPATVTLYLSELAGRAKPSTIQRRVTAISHAHRAADYESPTRANVVRETLKGIRRALGTAQEKSKAILVEDLRVMVESLDPVSLLGVRDRALLLLGFAAALRRSELVALDVRDVEFRDQGMVLTVLRSKNDQEGQGRRVGVLSGRHGLCAVSSLRAWMDRGGIDAGGVFRAVSRHARVSEERLSDRAVDLVVRRCAAAAGLVGAYSAHSLRAGLATSAARAGYSERDIARQTGHSSMAVLRGYIREGELFRNNVTGLLSM